MDYPIRVNYSFTDNAYRAYKVLSNLPELVAMDFEVSSKFSIKEKDKLKLKLEDKTLSFEDIRTTKQQVESFGLSHPSLTLITHLSIAWSDRDSFVIVCSNNRIRNIVLNFITTSNITQLWHNSVFDFKHIFYHTKKIPNNYIDTQLLAKSILNDANGFKNKTGLKELMEYAYGAWAIPKDNFTLEDMWNPDMIKYSATDSAATFKLYEDILKDQQKWKI